MLFLTIASFAIALRVEFVDNNGITRVSFCEGISWPTLQNVRVHFVNGAGRLKTSYDRSRTWTMHDNAANSDLESSRSVDFDVRVADDVI